MDWNKGKRKNSDWYWNLKIEYGEDKLWDKDNTLKSTNISLIGVREREKRWVRSND